MRGACTSFRRDRNKGQEKLRKKILNVSKNTFKKNNIRVDSKLIQNVCSALYVLMKNKISISAVDHYSSVDIFQECLICVACKIVNICPRIRQGMEDNRTRNVFRTAKQAPPRHCAHPNVLLAPNLSNLPPFTLINLALKSLFFLLNDGMQREMIKIRC